MTYGMLNRLNYRGHVTYLSDLDNVPVRNGDIYSVTYTGRQSDPPELKKRVDACYIFDEGWHILTAADSDIKNYRVVTVYKEEAYRPFGTDIIDTIVARVEINETQGTVTILEMWPECLNDPAKKIELLPDIAKAIQDNSDIRMTDIDATFEFGQRVLDAKMMKGIIDTL